MKTRMLSLFIAAALTAGAASAKTPAPHAAPTPQQQAARAEIDRLVKRIEELSKQVGDDGDVRVIVRHGRGGPEWHGRDFDELGGDGEVVIKRLGPGDAPMALPGKGKREVRIERAGPGGVWKSDGRPGEQFGFGNGPGLGIVLASNPAATGVRIAAVTPASPAMKSGLRTGDVLLQVNGKTVSGSGDAAVENARALIGQLKDGQVVKLRYARQGKTHDAVVRAGEIRRVWAYSGDAGAPKALREFRGPQFRRGEIDELLPPGVEMEIQRLGGHDCGKGKKDCGLPVIYEAFRWQGLNLASIDTGLGRYFGTQQGVLVLSSGEDLKGLQSGDVIQKVGGAAVDSPRDVMRALRGKEVGGQVRFDVLRDRRALPVTVTVPKSRPLPFITPPPAPPAPPMAPRAPHAAPPMPPMAPTPPPARPRAAPPAPPAPPPPPMKDGAVWVEPVDVEDVRLVRIDEDAPEAEAEVEIELAPAR